MFQLVSLLLNICLCYDLIKTIQSPFTPASNRAKFYYIISIFVPLVITAFIVIYNTVGNGGLNANSCTSCLDKHPSSSIQYQGTQINGSGNIILAYTLSIYIIVAIYSTVFAFRRLNRPGVSKEVRSMFLKKHLIYVIVFIVLWTITLSQNYFTLFNPPNYGPKSQNAFSIALMDPFEFTAMFLGLRGPQAQQQVAPNAPSCGPEKNECGLVYFYYISGITTFTTGIFLTIARMFEPLFRFLVFSQFYEFWGEIYKSKDGQSEEEKQIENDALSSFLSSSLNVELVYILLNSITTFSKRSGKSAV